MPGMPTVQGAATTAPVALVGLPRGMEPGTLPSWWVFKGRTPSLFLFPKLVMIRRKKGGLLRVFISENSLCKDTNGSVQAEFRVIYLCRDCEALPRPEMYLICVYDCVNTCSLCMEDKNLPKDHISPLHHTSLPRGMNRVIYYAWSPVWSQKLPAHSWTSGICCLRDFSSGFVIRDLLP